MRGKCAEKQGENTMDKKDQESSIVTDEDSIRDVLLTWDDEE